VSYTALLLTRERNAALQQLSSLTPLPNERIFEFYFRFRNTTHLAGVDSATAKNLFAAQCAADPHLFAALSAFTTIEQCESYITMLPDNTRMPSFASVASVSPMLPSTAFAPVPLAPDSAANTVEQVNAIHHHNGHNNSHRGRGGKPRSGGQRQQQQPQPANRNNNDSPRLTRQQLLDLIKENMGDGYTLAPKCRHCGKAHRDYECPNPKDGGNASSGGSSSGKGRAGRQ
jgi:hypothetical protein